MGRKGFCLLFFNDVFWTDRSENLLDFSSWKQPLEEFWRLKLGIILRKSRKYSKAIKALGYKYFIGYYSI